MKKFTTYLMFSLLTMLVVPQAQAATGSDPLTDPANKELPVRVQELLLRVNEIKELDKSELSREERKELRQELRAINTELKETGNGIYLSIGAIIIIILLLILLL